MRMGRLGGAATSNALEKTAAKKPTHTPPIRKTPAMGSQTSKTVRRFPTRPPTAAGTPLATGPAHIHPTPTSASAHPTTAGAVPLQDALHPGGVAPQAQQAQESDGNGTPVEDPREEHKRLLEHYQKMAFDLSSVPKREFRKDNEMLTILNKRQLNAQQDSASHASLYETREINPTMPSTTPEPTGRLPTSTLTMLLRMRRTVHPAELSNAALARQFGLKEETLEVLLKHVNTPEVVFGGGGPGGAGGVSGGSERLDAIWVEDLDGFRRGEAKGRDDVGGGEGR